ncbi:MAG TPA: molecular chaperone TorD family protein [candidate division Zixibacteria bacterium]|nr:molecular chaperone TorD family protein [candidate division Zixibacteria bacterium]
MQTELELDGTEQTAIGGRSRLYALFSRAFRFPSAERYRQIQAGDLAAEALTAIGLLPFQGLRPGTLGRGTDLSYEAFQSAYMALFEIGGEHGPPAPLYEGEYGGGRLKVMEEVLRFYHFFGLRLSGEKRDRPDHLASELEFMHVLTFKEAEAEVRGESRRPYREAQRDFLRFHLNEFVSAVADKVGANKAPFYPEMARLAAEFCARDLAHLAA